MNDFRDFVKGPRDGLMGALFMARPPASWPVHGTLVYPTEDLPIGTASIGLRCKMLGSPAVVGLDLLDQAAAEWAVEESTRQPVVYVETKHQMMRDSFRAVAFVEGAMGEVSVSPGVVGMHDQPYPQVFIDTIRPVFGDSGIGWSEPFMPHQGSDALPLHPRSPGSDVVRLLWAYDISGDLDSLVLNERADLTVGPPTGAPIALVDLDGECASRHNYRTKRSGTIVGIHHPEVGPLQSVMVEPDGFAVFTSVTGTQFTAHEEYGIDAWPNFRGPPGVEMPLTMVLVVELQKS